MPWTRIAALHDVPPGSVIEAVHDGRPYAICNVAGKIRVISGVCPHAGGPLGMGALDGSVLACPFHAWEFDSATGVCLADDTVTAPAFTARVESGEVLADLPPGSGPGERA